jgi:molybdopterin converting factor small subunit
LRIRLYGRLGETIGQETEVDAPGGCTVADLRRRLAAGHPGAADVLHRSRACLAGTMIGDDRQLTAGDEIEFLPPVSGG